MGAFRAIVLRDLRVAFRRWSEVANPFVFFAVVVALFPLSLSPSAPELRSIGVGVVWIAALLSSLLALDGLFRNDAEDGSLEQLLLSPVPFGVTVLAKIAAHWLVSVLPLVLLVPLSALSFRLPASGLPTLAFALLLATPSLSVLLALGAALTVSLKRGGAIIGLLILPLAAPLLIFGTRATDFALHGEPVAGPLYLLAAMAAAAVSLGPPAVAAALKVGLE
ncbi:MAG TPA: heme exporter protein CcmB [Gammaproteobacteria bacterium]